MRPNSYKRAWIVALFYKRKDVKTTYQDTLDNCFSLVFNQTFSFSQKTFSLLLFFLFSTFLLAKGNLAYDENSFYAKQFRLLKQQLYLFQPISKSSSVEAFDGEEIFLSATNTFSCVSGLLSNPDFESGTTGWGITGTTTITSDAYFGTQAVVHTTSNGGVSQNIATTVGNTFSLSVFAKKSGTAAPVVGIKFFDASWNTLSDVYANVTSDIVAEPYYVELVAPANTAWVQAIGWNTTGVGNAYFDGFCLENWAIDGSNLPQYKL